MLKSKNIDNYRLFSDYRSVKDGLKMIELNIFRELPKKTIVFLLLT